MEEKQVEVYLGDKIGEEVTEKERFKEPDEKMERTAKNWAKLKIGYYGKAIVANTLMKAQFSYRSQVNTVTKQKKKAIQNSIRSFVWDSKKPLVAWHKLVQPIKAGGIALIDIDCAMDAQKISILKHMRQKQGQPWVNWMRRKEERVKERWGVRGNVYEYRPKRKELGELKEECLYENMLKIWNEVGGTTRRANTKQLTQERKKERKKKGEKRKESEEKREEKKKEREKEKRKEEDKKIEKKRKERRERTWKFVQEDVSVVSEQQQETYKVAVMIIELEEEREDEEVRKKREKKDEEEERKKEKRKREEEDLGIEIEDRFEKIEDIKTRDIYLILMKKRIKQEKTHKTNKALAEDYIRNELTTREKTYWFKLAHRAIQTNVRKTKWLKNENGEPHTNRCPMCKTEVETWEHYDYDCEQVQTYMVRLKEVYEDYMTKMGKEMSIWVKPTREEWRLDMVKMEREKEMVIAKGRYVYEKMRCKTDYRQRKRSNVDMLIEELKERLELTIERVMKKETEERRKKEAKETEERKTDEMLKARERADRGISREEQEAEDAAIANWADRQSEEKKRRKEEEKEERERAADEQMRARERADRGISREEQDAEDAAIARWAARQQS